MPHCPFVEVGVKAGWSKNTLHTTHETPKSRFSKGTVSIDDDAFISGDTVTHSSCPFLDLNLCLLMLCQATVLFILAVPGCGVSYIITCVGFPLTVLMIIILYHLSLTIKLLAKPGRSQLIKKLVECTLAKFTLAKPGRSQLVKKLVERTLAKFTLAKPGRSQLVKKLVERTLAKFTHWRPWQFGWVLSLVICMKHWLGMIVQKSLKLCKIGFERIIVRVVSKEQGTRYPRSPCSLLPSQASDDDPTQDKRCCDPLFNEAVYEEACNTGDFGKGTSLFREGSSLASGDDVQEEYGHLVINGVRPELPRRPPYNPAMVALHDEDPPLPPPIVPPKPHHTECHIHAQVVDVEFTNVNVELLDNELVLEKNVHPPPIPQGELVPPFPPIPDNPPPRARVEDLPTYLLPFVCCYGPVLARDDAEVQVPPGIIPRKVGKAQVNLTILLLPLARALI